MNTVKAENFKKFSKRNWDWISSISLVSNLDEYNI